MKVESDSSEDIISLFVKCLYTNVPIKVAIDIVFRKIYDQEKTPGLALNTMKRLLSLAVGQVHFKCKDMCKT